MADATTTDPPSPARPAGRRGHHDAPTLVMPARAWEQFRTAMCAARPAGHEEVLGFFFCTHHRLGRTERYLVKHWHVPSPEDYTRQSVGGLTLKQEAHARLLERYIARGLHPVHIHTHPCSGPTGFSAIDDHHEAGYAAALRHLPGRPRLLSGVFDHDLRVWTFRLWPTRPDEAPRPVHFVPTWIPQAEVCEPEAWRYDRQRVFGAPVQRQLGALTVALVGCGGIGAPFAEQVARLGVRSWLLVDDNRLALTNLHRMPFATPRMAEVGRMKVDYAGTLIQRFWGRAARVCALARPVEDESVGRRLAGADLIVVATDNHYSRLAAQRVALRYQRPLLCLGTLVEQRPGEAAPRIYARVTLPPVDGGWCVACGGVINLEQAAMEVANPQTRQRLAERGYLDEVPAPAVYWVNTACAALAAGLVHGLLAGFVDGQGGVDWLIDLARGHWLRVEHDEAGDCFFCSPDGLYAAADG